MRLLLIAVFRNVVSHKAMFTAPVTKVATSMVSDKLFLWLASIGAASIKTATLVGLLYG